jgi:hypothetical protein
VVRRFFARHSAEQVFWRENGESNRCKRESSRDARYSDFKAEQNQKQVWSIAERTPAPSEPA